jgi:hypothetical protein
VKPITRGAPDNFRQQRGLDQSLQIDDHVVVRAPHLADGLPQRPAARRPVAIVDGQPAIEHGHEIQDSACFALTSQSMRADGIARRSAAATESRGRHRRARQA